MAFSHLETHSIAGVGIQISVWFCMYGTFAAMKPEGKSRLVQQMVLGARKSTAR